MIYKEILETYVPQQSQQSSLVQYYISSDLYPYHPLAGLVHF